MSRSGPSPASLAAAIVLAAVSVQGRTSTAAPSLLECGTSLDSLVSLSSSLQSDGEWAKRGMVLLEGFVLSVHADQHEFTVQVEDGAAVTVVAPSDVDITGFGEDLVRVHGLASTLHGTPAVLLQRGEVTLGGLVACPAMQAHATRKLSNVDTEIECNSILPGVDLAGSNLDGVPSFISGSEDACLDSCEITPGCTGWSRLNTNGRCWLKDVPQDHPTSVDPRFTSYFVCPGDENPNTIDPDTTTPVDTDPAECNAFLPDIDLQGGEITGIVALLTASAEGCKDSCEATDGCTAMSWRSATERCYLKDVPQDHPQTGTVGFTSYIICDDGAVDPVAPTPAVVPEEAPVVPVPANEAEAFFSVAAGDCPGEVSSQLASGQSNTMLNVPVVSRSAYQGDTALSPLDENNQITLSYTQLEKGGTYCWQEGQERVTVGGTIMISADGQCSLPPTAADGSACCKILTWQPNQDGFYYTDCSMTMDIGGDGVFYFDTENPGNEEEAGWGPDPQPHIHYDLECSGCDGDIPLIANKFYTNEVWAEGGAGPQHGATQTTFNGQTTYVYNIILEG